MNEETIRRQSSFFVTLVVTVLLLFLSSCAPVQGYGGPKLPDDQVSYLFLSYDSDEVAVDDAEVNGISFGAAGVSILPGEHRFSLDVALKEPPDNCYAYPKYDYYNFNKCKKKKDEYCNCFDFLEVRQRCYRQVRDGSCRGEVQTRAGNQYDLHLTKDYRDASLSIYERGARRGAGEGSCSMGGQRTETEDSYVGTGQSTAYQHGITSCY